MSTSPLEAAQLRSPTPPDKVRQRQGAKLHDGPCEKPCRRPHMMLDYVDARHVMEVLDALGPENWQCQYLMEGQKVACGIGINIDGEWVWKWDGAGETDIEGEKGSFSDAFKRAGVKWGIARDLYPDVTPKATIAAPPLPADMGDMVPWNGPVPEGWDQPPKAATRPVAAPQQAQEATEQPWPLSLVGTPCKKHPDHTWAADGRGALKVWHGPKGIDPEWGYCSLAAKKAKA